MPAASEGSTKKRATTKTASKKASAKKRAKRVSAKKTSVTTRKAPSTASVPQPKTKKRSYAFPIALIGAFIVVSGVSAYIGMSDNGAINASARIKEKIAALEAKGLYEESAALRGVGTTKTAANDGLVGAGNKETRQQAIEKRRKQALASSTNALASSTATSTASSTEPLSDPDKTEASSPEVSEATVSDEDVALENEEGETVPVEDI